MKRCRGITNQDPIYQDSKTGCSYYESIQVSIPTKNYSHLWLQQSSPSPETKKKSSFLQSLSYLSNKMWTVRVGDIVVVHCKSQTVQSPKKNTRQTQKRSDGDVATSPNTNTIKNPWYPFTVSWGSCQILAIHSSGSKKSDFQITIRWFYRTNEISLKDYKSETYHSKGCTNDIYPEQQNENHMGEENDTIEEIYESDHIDTLSIASLLGKVSILHDDMSALHTNICDEDNLVPTVNYRCNVFFSIESVTTSFISYTNGGKCHVDNADETLNYKLSPKSKSIPKNHLGILVGLQRVLRGLRYLLTTHDEDLVNNSIEILFNRVEKSKNLQNITFSKKPCVSSDGQSSQTTSKLKRTNVSTSESSPRKRVRRTANSSIDEFWNSTIDNVDTSKKRVQFNKNDDEICCDDDDSISSSKKSTQDDIHAWVSIPPYHVDVSALRVFHSEINILPPYESYDEPYYSNIHDATIESDLQTQKLDKESYNTKKHWTVRIGDAVAVHCVEGKSMNLVGDGAKHYPFTVPFRIGQVLSIFQKLEHIGTAKRIKEATNDDESMHRLSNKQEQFIIEIRWLYTKHQIPGVVDSSTLKSKVTEIFETDEVLDIPVVSLLGPVDLLSGISTLDTSISSFNGIPLLHFFCHRSWSVHRKTMMPVGTIGNRIHRGLMYSKYHGRDKVARTALNNTLHDFCESNIVPDEVSDDIDYNHLKNRYQNAIAKLTLTDASSGAQYHENGLIGRDIERTKITLFLLSSIRRATSFSDINQGSAYSMFIAGPPGTGKTASVRSIISKLRRDQADGIIPEFDFIYLNGMEMRHPFDAYVRLWEAVSGNKQKCSPGEAAARLETLFGGSIREKTSIRSDDYFEDKKKKRTVTVVLLDEIDYLVTNKQTVLYNFFDWPIRGSIANSDAQLIVIGISNTLNLPERLQPRVQSRLGKERCIYQAYNIDDSIKILKGRLGITNSSTSSIFQLDAIEFAARKTAAASGDIRKAFHLCKAAAEAVYTELFRTEHTRHMAETNNLENKNDRFRLVNISDIQKASREMFGTMLPKAVSHSTAFEALLFVSIASLKRHSGRELGGFDVEAIMTKMSGIALAHGEDRYLPPPTFDELIGMLTRLGEARLLSLQTPNGSDNLYGTNGASNTIVSLQLEDYEILNALKNTSHSALAEKHLAKSIFM